MVIIFSLLMGGSEVNVLVVLKPLDEVLYALVQRNLRLVAYLGLELCGVGPGAAYVARLHGQ